VLTRARLASLALAAALVVAPSPARADSLGLGGLEVLAYMAAAVVVVDAGLTTYDVVVAAKGERPAPGVCVAEMLIAAPQIPVAIGFAKREHDTSRGLGVGVAAWTTALVAHGIWGVVAAARHAGDAPPGSAASALSSPARAPIGLSLGGAF
jgi:hypothetical protein